MEISPFAGTAAEPAMLVDVPKLVMHIIQKCLILQCRRQRVAFGTSGIVAQHLTMHSTNGIYSHHSSHLPLPKTAKDRWSTFSRPGHNALSVPASVPVHWKCWQANGWKSLIEEKDEYTPTPVISHAILTYNRWTQNRTCRWHSDHAFT